jgi:hypothetical protein
LDLVSIVSKKDTEVTIVFKQWKHTCLTKSSTDIINSIRAAYYTCFPSIQDGAGFKADVSPPSRFVSTVPHPMVVVSLLPLVVVMMVIGSSTLVEVVLVL